MHGAYAITPGAALTIKNDAFDPGAPDRDSFAFVTNVARIDGAQELELVPGHVLRRASPEEIEIIKTSLNWTKEGPFGLPVFPWEVHHEADGSFTQLPESEWEYFVIAFRGTNDGIVALEQVFCIGQLELKVAFTAVSWPPLMPNLAGRLYHPGRLFQLFNHPVTILPKRYEVTSSDAEEIARLFTALMSHDPNLVQMERIARQMLELEELRPDSTSQFLAYFGILESLLTHKPDPKDPYDSITRQVKNKVALLNHRWTPALDYSAFRETTSEDVVWTRMYGYRSTLAHGDVADFTKSDLKLLGSHQNAMALLKTTVKAIARLALTEPRLLADLKNC